MFRLVFDNSRSPYVGREPLTVIGREPGCSLQLAEAGISERHAAIERRADGVYIRDLGSANGVRVNGQPVTEQRLATGDEIELGAVRAAFEIVHEPPPEQRAFDPLQWLATGVVACLVAGQVALFVWIFSQQHPRHARTDILKGTKQQAKAAATNEAPPRVLAPLPATPTSDVGAPASTVLNRKLRIMRVDGVHIQIKAQVAERTLDPAEISVSVHCGAAVQWLPVPTDWENFTSRTLNAPCAGSAVRTYYRKILQDEWPNR